MTQAEQASLEAVAARMDAGFREIRGDMATMRDLIESRRRDDSEAHKVFNDRLVTIESGRDIVQAFFRFGIYVMGFIVALAGTYFTYLGIH